MIFPPRSRKECFPCTNMNTITIMRITATRTAMSTGGKPMSHEEVLALLTYMLDHNRHHADELHDICHALEDAGKTEAAAALAEALHEYDHGNSKLEKALELAKQN